MISHLRRKWIAAFYFLVIPSSVDLQVAMYPMYPPPPPPMHFAAPMPMPMPIVIRERDKTTTSTTKTKISRVALTFPLPMPMQVPPPPMLASAPVVVVPFPPQPLWQTQSRSFGSSRSSRYSSDCTDTESSDESSSSSNERRRKRRRRRKKQGHMNRRPTYRKHFRSIEMNDNELVKPVLTYLSKDGDIKLKRRLSNDEADELIHEKPYQKINVIAENDGNMPRVLITSQNLKKSERSGGNNRRRQVVLTPGSAQHMLGEGKKELVFRPPTGKKISNLSVSFQISE